MYRVDMASPDQRDPQALAAINSVRAASCFASQVGRGQAPRTSTSAHAFCMSCISIDELIGLMWTHVW
jgi:hypothetical protein